MKPEAAEWILSGDGTTAHEFYSMVLKPELEPEKALMLALLQDAHAMLCDHACAICPKEQEKFKDAMYWLMKEEEEDQWLFSFENVCFALELDADYVRRGILHQVERIQYPNRRNH